MPSNHWEQSGTLVARMVFNSLISKHTIVCTLLIYVSELIALWSNAIMDYATHLFALKIDRSQIDVWVPLNFHTLRTREWNIYICCVYFIVKTCTTLSSPRANIQFIDKTLVVRLNKCFIDVDTTTPLALGVNLHTKSEHMYSGFGCGQTRFRYHVLLICCWSVAMEHMHVAFSHIDLLCVTCASHWQLERLTDSTWCWMVLFWLRFRASPHVGKQYSGVGSMYAVVTWIQLASEHPWAWMLCQLWIRDCRSNQV